MSGRAGARRREWRAWGLHSKGFGEPEVTGGPQLASPVSSLRAEAASASEWSQQRVLGARGDHSSLQASLSLYFYLSKTLVTVSLILQLPNTRTLCLPLNSESCGSRDLIHQLVTHCAPATGVSLILEHMSLVPDLEALHWLFPLPGMLFPNIPTWLSASPLPC